MEYFTSAENHSYYHWQLELLIESFKEIQLEKNIVVSLSKSNSFQNPLFLNNIIKHKRIQGYENIGNIRGHDPLNKLYSLLWTLRSGLIKQPLFYLPTDVVIRSEPDIQFGEYPEFVFYPDPFFTIDTAEKAVGPFWKWINKEKADYKQKWVPTNSLFAISNIPETFFHFVIHRAELFAVQQLLNNQPIWDQTIYLALATSLSDHIKNIYCRAEYSLMSNLLDGTNTPFISYAKGMLPIFHKSMFTYANIAHASFGNPIQILSENFPSPNANHVSILARKSLNQANAATAAAAAATAATAATTISTAISTATATSTSTSTATSTSTINSVGTSDGIATVNVE